MSRKVLRKIQSSGFASISGAHACLKSLKRFNMGNRPKFIEPMLRLASSGRQAAAGRMRSTTVMPGAPPVVRLQTTFERCLMERRNGSKASGVCTGRPSTGSRACRCTTAAPASAAAPAAREISSAVTGRCGDMEGVWMPPVTAQVMITLLAIGRSLRAASDARR